MILLILLFFIYLSSGELVTNATVEVYFDSLGAAYLNYEKGYINQIANFQNFTLPTGNIKATFEINDHKVNLLRYFTQLKPNEPVLGSYSPMYGKTIYIGIFRGAQRKDPNKCTPVAKAREYVRYVELGMRIWSGNQIKISQEDDLYISSQCLVIDEAIYVEGNHQKIMNALYDAAKATDDVPSVAVKWFITDDFVGGWKGLSVHGSPNGVANRNSNYWLICKYNPSVEDPKNQKLTTIMHDFGHNCGFSHGGIVATPATGTFTTFNVIDNYYDCANIMSLCGNWDRTITASQYWQIIVGTKPEPWYFKELGPGVHKYRLYAFDHPYSRYFLGTSKAFHNDTEVFDGIEFGCNCVGIRILVNESFTSKYTGQEGTSGSIMLEYKWNPNGQQGAEEFGIRITYGYNSRGNLLMANLDHLQQWSDSEIIPGVDYYPADFDTGTFRIRVLKVHRTVLKELKELEIVKEDKREYDEPSYIDLEIEAYPNKKYTPPSSPKDLPNFIFSPSFYNCKKNDDESGYVCEKSTTDSGWYYFINNGNRDKNVPRLYASGNGFIRGRVSLRSYDGGADYSNTKVCYGDDGFKCITVNVTSVSYSNVTRANYQNVKVTRTKTGDIFIYDNLGNHNVIYGSGLEVPEGGRAYITDLFGNERNITIIDNVFVELLPVLETDGFAEGAVIVKDEDGKVIYYDSFTFYRPENGNRVAIEIKENGKFEITPATMPSNKYYTTTSLLYSILLEENKWFNYPILNLTESDYVLIDFNGTVPSGLTMTIETDMGEYSRDLRDLGNLSSVSYKLTFMEINKATGGWAEIDRIKFNKDVEIQNIRPIYKRKVGNQIEKVNGTSESFEFDGFKYYVEGDETGDDYIFNIVRVEINGTTYLFYYYPEPTTEPTTDIPTTDIPTTETPTTDIPTTEIPTTEIPTKSNDKDDNGLSNTAIIGIVVGVVVVVLAIAIVIVGIIFCRSRTANPVPNINVGNLNV